MKQFIVLIAVLPLLLVFFAQFTLDQINSSRIGILTDCVYMAKEEARQDGYYTKDNLDRLKQKIEDNLGIDKTRIEIDASSTVQYRITNSSANQRGLIHLKLRVPIGEIMAGKNLFGVRGDTTYYYTIENYSASEKLR